MLDKNQIYVINNFLPLKEQEEILNEIVYSGCPRVYYFTHTIHDKLDPSLKILSEEQFVSPTFGRDTILKRLENKFSISVEKVINSKINWIFRKDISQKDHMYPPHTDILEPCWVLIYYVLDSDGETLLFNQTLSDIPPNTLVNNYSKLTIKQRISPKKGTALLFWSDRYHAGKPPIKNDYRVLINYNFTVK